LSTGQQYIGKTLSALMQFSWFCSFG